jgi:DNA-binding transcriptional MocR family regulator
MKKYERLAAEIDLQISQGLIQAGEKIGSIREMSHSKGVGINTVVRAYEILEDRGRIINRPQSGFYALSPRITHELTPSRPRKLVPQRIDNLNLVSLVFESAQDPETVQFGAACLAPDLYPSKSINKLIRSVVLNHPDVLGRYELPPGNFDFRRQVSRRLEKFGCSIDPSEIFATNGAMDALSLALRVTCRAGDTVLIESPQYFGILQALQQLQLKVVEVPTHPIQGISLHQIEDSLRKFRISAAIFIPNFSNPMGILMSDEKKAALVELLSCHGVPIIEDDVYAELAFQGTRPKPLKAYDRGGGVLTCSSFSKTVSPGLRIGWLATGRYQKQIQSLQLAASMGAGSLAQNVMANYIGSRDHERHLRELQLHCLHQVERFSHTILSKFPENTQTSSPLGGFVLWVELPSKTDSIELYRKALKDGISLSPGPLFSATGRYRNYIRLNCGNHWTPEVESAIARIAEHVDTISRNHS